MDLTRKVDRAPIARRMAELREQHGATQQACADALGLAQNTYAEMEANEIRMRRRDLVTLAVLYQMEPADAFPAFFNSGRKAAA